MVDSSAALMVVALVDLMEGWWVAMKDFAKVVEKAGMMVVLSVVKTVVSRVERTGNQLAAWLVDQRAGWLADGKAEKLAEQKKVDESGQLLALDLELAESKERQLLSRN